MSRKQKGFIQFEALAASVILAVVMGSVWKSLHLRFQRLHRDSDGVAAQLLLLKKLDLVRVASSGEKKIEATEESVDLLSSQGQLSISQQNFSKDSVLYPFRKQLRLIRGKVDVTSGQRKQKFELLSFINIPAKTEKKGQGQIKNETVQSAGEVSE